MTMTGIDGLPSKIEYICTVNRVQVNNVPACENYSPRTDQPVLLYSLQICFEEYNQNNMHKAYLIKNILNVYKLFLFKKKILKR